MFEYKMKIEKERIYRNYKQSDVIDFKTWLIDNYELKNDEFIMVVNDENKYFKFNIRGLKMLDNNETKEYILGLLTDYKEYFIGEYCSVLQGHYIDIKSEKHKEIKARLDILMSIKGSKDRLSLFVTLSKIKEDFMSFEPLVAAADLEEPKVNNKVDSITNKGKAKLVGKARDRVNERDNQKETVDIDFDNIDDDCAEPIVDDYDEETLENIM